MSTSTTHRSGSLAYVGVGAAPDQPQFHVRFTSENALPSETPSNTFRWIGWATLHIGAFGVLVSARRRGWMGFHRRERRFFPSAEIRNVYREGGAVCVELADAATGPQSFKFWPADLKIAATIVALLPTANTVEIDAPAANDAPASPRRRGGWVLAAAAATVAALVVAGVLFLHQGERSLQAAGSITVLPIATATGGPGVLEAAAKPAAVPDGGAFEGMREFERIEPQIEGLKTQFSTALTALELGSLSQSSFSNGLETWLIPQWRTLSNEVGEAAPPQGSTRYDLHENLVNVTLTWESALESYANGLRQQDTDRNLAAVAQMRHAADLERQARQSYAVLEKDLTTPTEAPASPPQ